MPPDSVRTTQKREEPNSRHPEDFARVGALGLLPRLEVTHVDGLTIRIKRAFHKAGFTRDASGKRNLGWRRRRGRSRGRRAARRSHLNRRWCRRVFRCRRNGAILRRHRSVGIRSLHCRSIGVRWRNAVNIRRLLLRDSITRRHIQRTTTTTARWWWIGIAACCEACGDRDQQGCLQETFHSEFSRGREIGKNQAFTRMGIST